MEELKVGDRVKIADDSPLVRRVLNETFLQCPNTRIPQFGGIGYVTKIDIGTRDNRVYCMVRPIKPTGDTYGWPAILLEKLPVSDSHRSMAISVMGSHGSVGFSRFAKSMDAVAKADPVPAGGAQIVFDHVVNFGGKCMLQIAEIKGISPPDKLPSEYLASTPMMYLHRSDAFWISSRFGEIVSIGDILTEEEAAKLVKRMRACGKRLHDINVAARAKADEARLKRWKAKGRKVVRI